jgi:rod shape determining protein RodA
VETKRRLQRIDWVLVVTVLALCGAGLLVIASATRTTAVEGDPLYYVKKQVLALGIGLSLAVMAAAIDYHTFRYLSNLFYIGNLGLLLAVLAFGKETLGAQRWIQVGPLALQPSEVAKVVLILTLANLLAHKQGKWKSWLDLGIPLAHTLVPVLLILRQPDLGTSLVFAAVVLGMLFVSGAPLRQLGILVGTALASVVGALYMHLEYGMKLPLREYQVKRLIVFLNPSMDPLNSGYHIIQSLIAIGSGGLTGKSLFSGTQSGLAFLPFQHTDFVFSVVGEEMGFAGGAILLCLYLILILKALSIAGQAKDVFGALIAAGIASMWSFHVFVNIGMTMGVMPITGLPLPFLSYGGSSLITNLTAMGLLINVNMRRHKISF